MFDSLVCEISEQFAKRFRSVERMAAYQLLDLEKSRLDGGYVTCHTHLTEGNKLV
jgi:hypothetical protein